MKTAQKKRQKNSGWHSCKKGFKKGFTLIFALLIATVVLAIGASLAAKAVKELILSSTGQESVKAFYAANTGLECALYWDKKGVEITGGAIFATSSPPAGATWVPPANIDCNSEDISSYWSNGGSYLLTGPVIIPLGSDRRRPTTTFYLGSNSNGYWSGSGQICAQVTVAKTLNIDGSISTEVKSRGYNSCDLSNPRTVDPRGCALQECERRGGWRYRRKWQHRGERSCRRGGRGCRSFRG